MNDRLKGSIYVYGQFLIIVLALVSSILEPWLLHYPSRFHLTFLGILTAIAGILLMTASVRSFKQEITPHPIPKEEYRLMTKGMYGLIRHPIYFSAVVLVAGGTLILQAYYSLFWSAVLLIWFNRKASFEEKFLELKFPDYSLYKKNTRKLIPFLY